MLLGSLGQGCEQLYMCMCERMCHGWGLGYCADLRICLPEIGKCEKAIIIPKNIVKHSVLLFMFFLVAFFCSQKSEKGNNNFEKSCNTLGVLHLLSPVSFSFVSFLGRKIMKNSNENQNFQDFLPGKPAKGEQCDTNCKQLCKAQRVWYKVLFL